MSIEKMKYYFEHDLWSKEMVSNLVVKGRITAEQYKEITGLDYAAA